MENQKNALRNFKLFFQIIFGSLLLVWMFSWEKDFEKENFFQFSDQKIEDDSVLRNKEVAFEERIFQGGEKEIIDLVNQARSENKLSELQQNDKLSRSAQAKALDMKNKNYFQHVSPEGVQPWFFAEKEKYQYKFFGENLAEGFFSADEVHMAWMNSEGHRKNILSENFSEIGVGIVDFEQNGMKSYLVVQHFGTQLTPEELIPQVVCRKEAKEDCLEGKAKLKEVKEAIENQEDIIEDAEDAGVKEDDLKEAEENLEKLKEIKKELKVYLEKCEKFIENCDKWE